MFGHPRRKIENLKEINVSLKATIVAVKETISSVSDLLFPLHYRGRALALLLLQPQRRIHLREIARLTSTVAGTMGKELDRLYKAGLLEKHRVGNQTQFCANVQHPVFVDLTSLLRKTIGLADVLVLALSPVAERIQVAFVFGSAGRSGEVAHSDVDVMLIGDIGFSEAIDLLFEAQTQLGREINPKVFGVNEWRAKIGEPSSFVLDVLAKPKIFLIGSQSDLDQLV
jgi:predicted nucleotidyltransferase